MGAFPPLVRISLLLICGLSSAFLCLSFFLSPRLNTNQLYSILIMVPTVFINILTCSDRLIKPSNSSQLFLKLANKSELMKTINTGQSWSGRPQFVPQKKLECFEEAVV